MINSDSNTSTPSSMINRPTSSHRRFYAENFKCTWVMRSMRLVSYVPSLVFALLDCKMELSFFKFGPVHFSFSGIPG